MQLGVFQVLCLVVLLVAYAVDVLGHRRRGRRLIVIGVLAASACVGEHTVIEAYEYYLYAPGWWLPVGHVPLLVPLIWPLVVLSAREVVRALWPASPRSADGAVVRALRVGAIVVFDASIMEVCAVVAGYWSWAEGGYLGVPLMGIVGWGVFGFVASLWLDHAPEGGRGAAWLALTPVVTVAATHVGILALWWGLFRWGPRVDLETWLGPWALVGFGVLAAAYATAVGRARQATGAWLPYRVTASRALATSVFVALLVSLSAGDTGAGLWRHWTHLGLAAVPYLLASAPGAPASRARDLPDVDVLG